MASKRPKTVAIKGKQNTTATGGIRGKQDSGIVGKQNSGVRGK